jgi:hypothetical protein
MNVYHIYNQHSGADLWTGVATDEHDALAQLDATATYRWLADSVPILRYPPLRYGTGPRESGLAWRTLEAPTTLGELRELLPMLHNVERDVLQALGLPDSNGWLDMSSLPTFGGKAPADTTEVLSWDATHLLVGDSAPWAIVPREE